MRARFFRPDTSLIDDGIYGYTYDAPALDSPPGHRPGMLCIGRVASTACQGKVQASADSRAVTIQTAEFDALGRRIKKVVTNSGNLDATTVYLYGGVVVRALAGRIIETRDGSNNMVSQVIHGTQYIDELAWIRITGKGDFYYHQDANWNVIALTDLGGSVLERYDYTAYGEMTVHQETSFGDRDGDQDVDSTDKGTVGVTCTGTVSGACRILDLDFDGDYDATDATAFDALDQGLSRHPGRTFTGVDQPFSHQGLLYDAEIGSYQNRARQYDPVTRRFMQRDPARYRDGMNLYEYVRSSPAQYSDPTGFIIWSSLHITRNVAWPWETVQNPQTGPIGIDWSVLTDGNFELRAWKGFPIEGSQGVYWCHGFTFDGSIQPNGPFSFYGQEVPIILSDDGWIRVQCCANPLIVVFYGLNSNPNTIPTHSGKVVEIVLTDGAVDENNSTIISKRGQAELAVWTLAAEAAAYGDYACYAKEAEPVCCGRGLHEVDW